MTITQVTARSAAGRMKAWRQLQSFLTALFQRTRFEREMTAELEHHVAERTEDLVARGALPGDAARRAMQELGDPLRWKEAGREARGLRLVDDLRTDAIYGVRWLRRLPGFAVAALASLALGIGANVAVFNLLDDVMVRALPVDWPEELVLFGAVEGASDPSHTFSYRALQFFREQSRTLAAIAASASIRVSVERDGQMLPTAAAQVVSGQLLHAARRAGRPRPRSSGQRRWGAGHRSPVLRSVTCVAERVPSLPQH